MHQISHCLINDETCGNSVLPYIVETIITNVLQVNPVLMITVGGNSIVYFYIYYNLECYTLCYICTVCVLFLVLS